MTGEVRPPIEAAPGRVARYDTEYQRNGTRNLFMICEPKGGWRHVEVTERRTAVDFAHQMRWLVDEAYPDAEVVRLVLDNLNTHKLGSLYEAAVRIHHPSPHLNPRSSLSEPLIMRPTPCQPVSLAVYLYRLKRY